MHVDVLRADVGVRIDRDRPHVDEGAGLDDDAPRPAPSGGPRRRSRESRCNRARCRGRCPPVCSRAARDPLRHVGRRHRRWMRVGAEGLRKREPGGEAIGRDELAAPRSFALIRWQSPRGPTPSTATRLRKSAAADEAEKRLRRLDAMRHRHDLGQHRNVVRQIVRHSEDRRARGAGTCTPPSRRRDGAPGRNAGCCRSPRMFSHM